MNQHIEKAKALRAQVPPAGNCAQTILRVYAAELGLSEEQAAAIAANFGGGMKRGSVCGAVTAALMVLGAAGITDAASAQQFQTAFAQKHDGMLCCADLLKTECFPHRDGLCCPHQQGQAHCRTPVRYCRRCPAVLQRAAADAYACGGLRAASSCRAANRRPISPEGSR